MNHLESVDRSRCLLVWLLATVGAALAVAWVAPDLTAFVTRGPAEQPFDRALVSLASFVLTACAGWAWAATTVVVAQALRGRPSAGAAVVPGWLRTTVLVACGLAVVGTGGAAVADEETARARADHQVLAGLPSPDRVVGLVPAAPSSRSARVHVVQPGDTLWELAEAELGAGAQWPRIYAQNLGAIGADPDLIHPGQKLRLPTEELDR